MSKKTPRISFRFQTTEELQALLKEEAKKIGGSKADVLRSLILTLKASQPQKVVLDVDTEKKRFTLRLAKTLDKVVELKAKSKAMSKTRWIESLVKMAALKKTTLTETELCLLRESNRQLLAIGNNLNQIAKHFNTQALNNSETNLDILKLKLLQDLQDLINKNTEAINTEINSSENTW